MAGYHYSLGVIHTSWQLVVGCRTSLRAGAEVIELFSHLLGTEPVTPHYVTLRGWLLRIGLHELERPKEQADDWMWIVDHTMQLGDAKCLIILGVRQSAWEAAEDRRLGHEDVELIALEPVRTSNGEVVAEQLKQAAQKTGTPRVIVSDDGTDLRRGLRLFREEHPSTAWMYDITHQTAVLLKHELETNPTWKSFIGQVNRTKQKTYVTPLAFLTPPQLRGKARYMSVDKLVAWGEKVLSFLDDPQAAGRHELDPAVLEEKLGWLRDFREPLANWAEVMAVIAATEHYVRTQGIHRRAPEELQVQLDPLVTCDLGGRFRDRLLAFIRGQAGAVHEGERLLGTSEVIESVIGKYKSLQGEQSQHGLTPMILSIGSFVGRKTTSLIKTALETFSIGRVRAWCSEHLGPTVQSQRKIAFARPKHGTKMEPIQSG